jgi:hypothetical protein
VEKADNMRIKEFVWLFLLNFILWPMQSYGKSQEDVLPLHSTKVVSLDGNWLLATDPNNIGRQQQWWKKNAYYAKTHLALSLCLLKH